MTRTVRRPITAVAVVAGTLAGVLSLSLVRADLPPCGNEDGSSGPVPCHWDAQEQGNGLGTSVTIWTRP
jgi:hypothetical protein